MDEQREAAEAVAQKVADLCSRNWWVFLIGGVASVAFGVLAFINPGIALLVLGMFFAAYVLVDGAANIWGAINNRGADGWWMILLLGIVGFLVGGYALLYPPLSMLALIIVVGFFALFMGISSIYLGWKIRAEVDNEWVLFLAGALSVLFALLMIFKPGIGGVSLAYMIASWAVLIGVLRIWFAFKVRGLNQQA